MTTFIIVALTLWCVFLVGFVVYQKYFQKKEKPATAPRTPAPSTPLSAPDSSLRDPVTNLYSRKHLLRRLQEDMARCDRSQDKLAVVLWDIDGFIDFNNRFGQKEGDEFLRKVADTIRKSIRIYDEAFRSGADEFCALLCPADQKIANDVTSRVSQAVSRHLFEGASEYADKEFSISAGVVFYPSEHKVPEALLYAAGEDLFRSKAPLQRGQI